MQATLKQNIHSASGYQTIRVEVKDIINMQILATGNEAAFELVFKTHFKALHSYAVTILKDEMGVEEIVQQIFRKLWERKE